MEESSETPPAVVTPSKAGWKVILRNTAYILAALLIFLLAIDLMISSLQHLCNAAAETIIQATSNPFTGLFIGLLVTAIIQSSSATTTMVVALVASGAISLQGAIPIIMGANVGTTITSTIVSLGFITRKKEFRRAIAAGTYHDFFNILTVLILFPAEYYYGFLSSLSDWIAREFFSQSISISGGASFFREGLYSIVSKIVEVIDNGLILILLSFALLFGSILFFRKVLSQLLGLNSGEQGGVQRFFFKSPIKAFGFGLVTTAAIRSSTITTSLVVPLVAKKVIRLDQAVPFILGANIGTTITAFIAAMSNSNIAISIAIAHFLFNLIGVLIFSLIPYVKSVPINLAKGLGKLTIRYRLVGFVYILMTFFFVPFSLIYLNRDSKDTRELTYIKQKGTDQTSYRIVTTTFRNRPFSSWAYHYKESTSPDKLVGVERRKNILMINNELFEFNRVGFCRDGEDEDGAYSMCVTTILPNYQISPTLSTDSVYHFQKVYKSKGDTVNVMISRVENIILSKYGRVGGTVFSETLKDITEK